MELVIVRHGRPVREERAEGEGGADPGLSEIGVDQARVTGEFLATEAPFDHIAASPMKRAAQTARVIADVLGLAEVQHLEALKEVDHLRSRYVPAEEIVPDDPLILEWRRNPMALFDDHGGLDAFTRIVVGGFDEIIDANPDRRVIVACHGGVMGAYLCHLLGTRDPFVLHSEYCAIMRVRVTRSGRRVPMSMNEHGHVRHLLTPRRLGV